MRASIAGFGLLLILTAGSVATAAPLVKTSRNKKGISFVFIISKEHSAQYKGRRKRRKWRVSVGKADLRYLTVGPRKRSAAGRQNCGHGAVYVPGGGCADPARIARAGSDRRTLTHRAFAQAGFQLVVLVDHVLFRGASAIRSTLTAQYSGVLVIGLRFSETSSLQAPIHHW